jgi:membrane protein YqaA with SNARE-associated domain
MRALVSLVLASSLGNWIHRLGGPGLILLGIIDNSAIPIPGGMDIFVILLSAHRREWWFYYAFMAIVGALLGGYLTYRLAEKGGEETVEKKIGKQRAQNVYDKFKKRGFATISVSAVLPPPFPMVPVLMAAGVLQYPRKKFLLSLGMWENYTVLWSRTSRPDLWNGDPLQLAPVLQTAFVHAGRSRGCRRRLCARLFQVV